MLERSLFLIPGVTYLGGGKRGNLWLYPLLIVTSLRYLSACSDGNSLSFPFSPVFVRYNCQPTRGVSLFDRSNSAFRLCSRREIACHFIETQILWKLFDTSVDRIFFGFFILRSSLELTPKLLLAFCDFFRGEILFLKY